MSRFKISRASDEESLSKIKDIKLDLERKRIYYGDYDWIHRAFSKETTEAIFTSILESDFFTQKEKSFLLFNISDMHSILTLEFWQFEAKVEDYFNGKLDEPVQNSE